MTEFSEPAGVDGPGGASLVVFAIGTGAFVEKNRSSCATASVSACP